MYHHTSKTKLMAGILAAVLGISTGVSASIIASDSFDTYEAGSIDGQAPAANSPFKSFSVTGGTAEVVDGSLGGGAGRHLVAISQPTGGGFQNTIVTAPLNTDLFADYLTEDGLIGADGTTLYISYRIRAESTSQTGHEGSVRLFDLSLDDGGLFSGKVFSNPVDTSYRVANRQLADIEPSGSRGVHVIVLGITFNESGNDTIKVWFDPTSATDEPTLNIVNFDVQPFDAVQFRTRQNANPNTAETYFDDIIFSTDLQSAIPEPTAMSLVAPGAMLLMRRRR